CCSNGADFSAATLRISPGFHFRGRLCHSLRHCSPAHSAGQISAAPLSPHLRNSLSRTNPLRLVRTALPRCVTLRTNFPQPPRLDLQRPERRLHSRLLAQSPGQFLSRRLSRPQPCL